MTFKTLVISLSVIVALGVALALVTGALASRREAAVKLTFPPLGVLLEVDGVRLHALTRGTGPDLVLIHGASGNLRDLLPLMDRLAGQYRVTAFDRPGLGWSDPIPQGATLKAQALHLAKGAAMLGITNPIVLGQSYGGSVALALALDAPLRPRALVLVSAPSLPWPGSLAPLYQVLDSWPGRQIVIPLATAFLPERYVDQVVKDIFKPDAAPADYLSYIGADLSIRRQALRTNADQVNGLLAEITAQSQRYGELTLPIELVHGTADTIVPITIHSLPLSKRMPNAHLTAIYGAGHMPHHAHPQAVVDAISRAAARAGLR
ncbi:MAG: alpha/beta hydrolase [Candidatus Saccharibacteria bacterium]|nr:alpha/beta hydrolase [Pseudorhodobacter sp.]